jgi:hypothetical protein
MVEQLEFVNNYLIYPRIRVSSLNSSVPVVIQATGLLSSLPSPEKLAPRSIQLRVCLAEFWVQQLI